MSAEKSKPDERRVDELSEFGLDAHPDLEGRVLREINRRTLVADGLEFSLTMMLRTFWDHFRALIDSLPSTDNGNSDRTD